LPRFTRPRTSWRSWLWAECSLLEKVDWRWDGVTGPGSTGGRKRSFATHWGQGFSDKPALADEASAKVIRIFFQILFLSEPVFGLVFSRRACNGLVPGFSISVFSPWDQRGISCSRNRELGVGIRADNGRFRSRNSPLDHSCVARCDRLDPPSGRENFLSGTDNGRDGLIRVDYELDLVLGHDA
jgi:hypothetical protein